MSRSQRTHRIDEFRQVAATYIAATGLSAFTVSQRIFGDGMRLPAILEKGADLVSRRLDNAFWWLTDNWPDGAEWPRDIFRPKRR